MLLMGYSSAIHAPSNLSPIHDKWEWQYQGACKGVDTEIFFLEHGDRAQAKRKKEQKAISICRACPVINECREHALRVPELYGVWGGMTADQRLALLKRKIN